MKYECNKMSCNTHLKRVSEVINTVLDSIGDMFEVIGFESGFEHTLLNYQVDVVLADHFNLTVLEFGPR